VGKSAVATAASTLVMGAAAATAGILWARKFGRGAETDGFLAAYGLYLVFALAAQTLRVGLVPGLTRAARQARLFHEARSYAYALLAVGVPISIVVGLAAHPLAELLTGGLPHLAAKTAGGALVWLVPAGFVQILAALAAAVLAAKDSYVTAALGFAAGAVSALVVFVLFADTHGPLSLAWGVAVGSAISLGLPLAALSRIGLFRRPDRPTRSLIRLGRVFQIIALPLALQGFYVLTLRLAADLHVGDVTSVSYAYIFAATIVAATASTLALISSAPLTRRGIDSESAIAHVVHSVWLSLAVVAAAAAVFALVGGRIAHFLLGSAFAGSSGHELGRVVVFLAPWMVASVALSVTFPLLFVIERRRILVPIAGAALVLHLALSLALRSAFGIEGLALALGVSTSAVLLALLAAIARHMLIRSAIGLAFPTLTVSVLAGLTFGLAALFLPDAIAAVVGLALYSALLLTLTPRPLREAWAYVRALD
jgi:putative peptidoglycan lipid II flippase